MRREAKRKETNMKEVVGKVVRHAVTGVAAWLIAKGWLSADQAPEAVQNHFIEEITGGAIFAANMLWMWFAHTKAARKIGLGLGLVAMGLSLAGLTGCAGLQPGADPWVVNAERAETMAIGTFDMVLNVDDANRAFFREKAPAFHEYCEWLRAPQVVDVTNTMPRGAALVYSMNKVKRDYKLGRAGSNQLNTVAITLNSILQQGSAWLTVVTNLAKP
jgi:hypothetical protein